MEQDTLLVDGSAIHGFNSKTFIADLFAEFDGGGTSFYGGTPDAAYGSVYYLNGSQVVHSFTAPEGEDSVETAFVSVLDGANLAYDFLHYGPSFGHGITGQIDSLTFGTWVPGVTSAEEGVGDAGRVSGLGNLVTIEGLDLSAEPGAGADLETNPVYALYKALQTVDAAAVKELISGHSLEVLGGAGDDYLVGYGGNDVLKGQDGDDMMRGRSGDDYLRGGDGDDQLVGAKGNDMLGGGKGDDELTGGKGADSLRGGPGSDMLQGNNGADTLFGGSGADMLYGGKGADTFEFDALSGADVIGDFNTAADRIDVSALGLAALDDFDVEDAAGGAVLTAGSVSITLTGVAEADLDAGFFIF